MLQHVTHEISTAGRYASGAYVRWYYHGIDRDNWMKLLHCKLRDLA
jgi:hypothetical protein